MKRKFLEELGIEKDAIDSIMAENGRDIESAKGELESVKAELVQAKAALAERDDQLKELKTAAGDNEGLSAKIAELEAANKEAEARHRDEINNIKINSALDMALTKSGAKTIKAVKALIDRESIKIDKEGNVTGLDEQIKGLMESEDTGYLFGKGGIVGADIGRSNSATNKSVDEMTYSELAAYMEANPGAVV